MRLRKAAAQSETSLPVDRIRRDDQCVFGKWLAEIAPELRGDAQFETAKRLHAQFHREAGNVAEMLANGLNSEASAALSETSRFQDMSQDLTRHLTAWRGSLRNAAG